MALTEYNNTIERIEDRGYHINPSGSVIDMYGNRLPEFIGKNGYKSIRGGVKLGTLLSDAPCHRLVALKYIPNPDNKPFVNHIDGNKLNNHVTNLEWVTPKENAQHAYATGLAKSKKMRNGRVIIDLNTGIFYNTAIEAAKAVDVAYYAIVVQLNGQYPPQTGLRYC